MEVVERPVRGAADERLPGFGDGHVVQAVPLEDHIPGRDVDLLHHAGPDRAAGLAAQSRQVRAPLPVHGEQRGPLIGEVELVHVRHQPVAGLDGGDHRVGGVGDVAGPFPEGPADFPLPPGQHRLALVGLHVEVHHLLAGHGFEPGDLPVPPGDHQARLPDGRPEVRLVRQKNVRRHPRRVAGHAHREHGRAQVAPGHIGVRRSRPRRLLRSRPRCLLSGRGRGPRPRIAGEAGRAQASQPGQHAATADKQLPARPVPAHHGSPRVLPLYCLVPAGAP